METQRFIFCPKKNNVERGREQKVDPGKETQLLQLNPRARRRLDLVPTPFTSAETKKKSGDRLLICNSEPYGNGSVGGFKLKAP